MSNYEFFETLTIDDIRSIAKNEGFRAYYKMDKIDLIRYLINNMSHDDILKYKIGPKKGPADPTDFLFVKPRKKVTETLFRGNPWYELISMIYLGYKHSDCCTIIAPGFLSKDEKLTPKAYNVRSFRQVSISWSEYENRLIAPEGIIKSIKNCLKKKVTFIIIPFGFSCRDSGHANLLIYNSITKSLERFEPYGLLDTRCHFPPFIDEKIAFFFNKYIQKGMVKEIYDPLSFCPVVSFQSIQEEEEEFKQQKGKNIGPVGYCASWSIWYADIRLSNPSKSRSDVIELALKELSNSPVTFTSFIMSYADFFKRISDIIEKSDKPLKEVIDKILKKIDTI